MAVGIEGRIAAELDRRSVWGFTDDEKFNREIARPWKDSAIDPHDFINNPYAREEVVTDLEKVQKIKKSPEFVHERRSEAVALEYVLMEGIKVHGWFGDGVLSVQKTSEYDDVMNGADFVVTFHDEDTDKFVHLAIDATTSLDEKVLFRKADKIFEKLAGGKMAKIKYFEDPDETVGEVQMPRVVLALSPEKTVALQKLMTNPKNAVGDAAEKYEFLASVENQLLKFINYILIRGKFLGEGRDLKSYGEVLEFMSRHDGDLDENTKNLISAHADVLQFVSVSAPKPKPLH